MATPLFAQPTADIPLMEQPPPVSALVDYMSIIFTRSLQTLQNAWWATVKRAEYMRIVRERKAECPTFANVVLREDEAATRLRRGGGFSAMSNSASRVDAQYSRTM